MIVKVLRPFEALNRVLKIDQLVDEEKEGWRNTKLLIQQRYVEEYRGEPVKMPSPLNSPLDPEKEETKTEKIEKTENGSTLPTRGRPKKQVEATITT